MLTAVIIDDEVNGREILRELITNYCPMANVIDVAASADEGIELIKKHSPDVVFLDIEMPFKNGFDVIKSFSNINFEIIFTTAYSHYAIKAIKFSALDYLLKPISVSELREALVKVEQKKLKESGNTNNIDIFLDNLKTSNNQLQKIVIKTMDGFDVVELKDIVHCKGERNYTQVFFADKKNVIVAKTLKDFEDMLIDFDFIRVHQSHLININHVKKYIKGRGGYAEMSDGSVIDISRQKKDLFIERFSLQF